MAQAMINFRMDADLKREMEDICRQLGMNLTTAFTIYAAKVVRDRGIPFTLSLEEDPFYSEENMERLRRAAAALDAGKGAEHDIEEYDV